MAKNTGKVWKKLKEDSKSSTTVGKIVRNTQLARIRFEYKQTYLFEKRGTCQFQFWELFQFANPQIHQFEDNGFIDSKNPVSVSSRNQGNHFIGHLWIQTDHNRDHKCPDYGQLGIRL